MTIGHHWNTTASPPLTSYFVDMSQHFRTNNYMTLVFVMRCTIANMLNQQVFRLSRVSFMDELLSVFDERHDSSIRSNHRSVGSMLQCRPSTQYAVPGSAWETSGLINDHNKTHLCAFSFEHCNSWSVFSTPKPVWDILGGGYNLSDSEK